MMKSQELQDQSLWGYATFDDLKFDGLSPSTQNCQEDQITKLGEIVQNGNQDGEHKKDKRSEELHLASLELLRRFGNGFRRLKSGRIVEPTYDAPPYTAVESRGFPPEEIMGIAGAKFIQSSLLPYQLMFPLSLRERIEIKSGRTTSNGLKKNQSVDIYDTIKASKQCNRDHFKASN
ncbi:hypothetical protein OIU85_003324 [Salix viminalis]|uniref:Uncharacterized protein n=1 Tax=Salix viminalis TaxID=40686 RepID=A0A9Q0PYX0_SALVM|nr:hypothetical protein OIU85_003317 [Salix viminalis]KAJ6696950.1 hypothetical protein OIU85_003324 [Salix viminalis]